MIRCDGPVPQRPTPQGGLSCPSGAIHLLPTSARLVPGWRALHVTFLTHDFWSCLRRAPFWAARKGRKSRLRRGIPISPALTIHPLKRPRRGNRNSPFLVVSRGMGVGKGENRNSPFPTGSFAPFWPLRKGPAGGLTRKQVSKRVPMEGAPARHKAGRCRQKVNCLREAKEAAPTVERTAHKTRPVSGPYLRRNTWTRKEARTRRPSRAASRSAPSLGVFQ